ncbi:MAG: folate-binding protein YgfZ [Acidobacteria bacterium]|nr:folate-binding protein YgfZ [Acidobacteriota bacterium]
MNEASQKAYEHIRSGGLGYYETRRGLIAVWGGEAVQFLDGLITNDVKTLGDGEQMLAAFPNARGRLLAVVRVWRNGDRFLIETEDATREKVFQNLFRFTFAGDFFVEDITAAHRIYEVFGSDVEPLLTCGVLTRFSSRGGSESYVLPAENADKFIETAKSVGAVSIDDDLCEVLRIESGVPKFGVDMDETTIVPELGIDGLISYNKGCYIGQEIIARIHFRGHVAKRLTGIMSEPGAIATGSELTSQEGKPAGRITSVAYSPKLGKTIALAYVRYEFLEAGTQLLADKILVSVTKIPYAFDESTK